MNYKVCLPERGEVRDERLGILYPNHGFSNVEHDAGRDGEALASRFGIPVIAFDRPGSGQPFSLDGELAGAITLDYTDVMKGAVRCLRDVLRENCPNIESLVAAGRSNGGLGALALTRAAELVRIEDEEPSLPIDYVYVAEPTGWIDFESRKTGKAHVETYENRQAAKIKSEDEYFDLVRPERPDVSGLTLARRNITIPLLYASETFHYQDLLRTPISARLAREIAVSQRTVELVMDFAEDSLVAPSEHSEVRRAISELQRLRGEGDALLRVQRVPNTVHKSFDKRSFFADQLAFVIERASHRESLQVAE